MSKQISDRLNAIVKHPDERLNTVATPVSAFDPDLKTVAKYMQDIVVSLGALGVSGNQIGFLKRIIAIRGDTLAEPLIMINPYIVSNNLKDIVFKEGCLSFPGLFLPIQRKQFIVVAYQDVDGVEKTGSFSDVEAVCIQHEIDHLNGILFTHRNFVIV